MELNPELSKTSTNGIKLNVARQGPVEGRPLLFLHGFPEFWYGWREQIPFFAEEGFRVLAPDQRGYNLSDKPDSISDYSIDKLTADVLGLIEQSGLERVNLVGHDWGGAVAWWIATFYPDYLNKLVILNIPHPSVFLQNIRSNPRQLVKSWYMMFFQLPWLPEALSSMNDFYAWKYMLRETSRHGTFSDEELERYVEAWSRPRAARSMLNWYRALLWNRPDRTGENTKVTIPTLILWGERDVAFASGVEEKTTEVCETVELKTFPESTHWVQHEQPDRINREILDFL